MGEIDKYCVRCRLVSPINCFKINRKNAHNKCCENCKIYKFILMDVDMPVMDGITATIEIRKFETLNNYKFTNIPASFTFT